MPATATKKRRSGKYIAIDDTGIVHRDQTLEGIFHFRDHDAQDEVAICEVILNPEALPAPSVFMYAVIEDGSYAYIAENIDDVLIFASSRPSKAAVTQIAQVWSLDEFTRLHVEPGPTTSSK